MAVRPSSSSPSSPWGWFIRPSRPSAPPKADIISVVRLSRSSSLMPIFFIISSMGLMPISLAHFRHRPSFLVVPFSILVIKITATFLPQRLHIVGCITQHSFREKGFLDDTITHNYELVVNWGRKRSPSGFHFMRRAAIFDKPPPVPRARLAFWAITAASAGGSSPRPPLAVRRPSAGYTPQTPAARPRTGPPPRRSSGSGWTAPAA